MILIVIFDIDGSKLIGMKFVRERNSQKWKWTGFDTHEERYIMTLADMDVPLYEQLKKEIVAKLRNLNNFTTKNPPEQFYQAIVNWYAKRHIKQKNVSIKREEIVEAPSLLNILYLLVEKYSKENEGVLLMTPVYNYYDRFSKYLKRKVIETRLYDEKIGNEVRWDINFTDFEEKAKSCKILIFCNPHNPSGRIWTQALTQKIVKICERNNILIISDEILCDLIPSQHASKFYSLVNSSYKRIVVCNSISKTFNAESLRGGYAIIKDQQIRKTYQQITLNFPLRNNEFSYICTEVFYSLQGQKWINYALSVIQENYACLLRFLEGTQLVVSQLEAAYIITIDFQAYLMYLEQWFQREKRSEPKRNMVSAFLWKNGIKGIEMIYGSQYGGILTNIRFAIAIQSKLFLNFCIRLRKCIVELQYQHHFPKPLL